MEGASKATECSKAYEDVERRNNLNDLLNISQIHAYYI